MTIEQQRHGYLRGHQLLASSVRLSKIDQDLIDRLSDIAGAPAHGESLPSYVTGYPLPSREYYVFARTWYDQDAPRAGCVLTHSLLISPQYWAGTPNPTTLTQLHTKFTRASVASIGSLVEMPPQQPRREVKAAPGAYEVLEALFLEKRQPVLWFADNAEPSVLAIVDALWPSLRREFSFQSYALKVRQGADGPFDLAVAPRSARGRLAAWPGRRVEGGSEVRHAWTKRLAHAVFSREGGGVSEADPLGLLRSDISGDPSKLRLSLLWSDLDHQAKMRPQALLGMLDVLAAAELGPASSEPLALDIARRAFDSVRGVTPAPNAGQFVSLLLEKLSAFSRSETVERLSVLGVADFLIANPTAGASLFGVNSPRAEYAENVLRKVAVEALDRGLPDDRVVSALLEATPTTALAEVANERPQITLALARASGARFADKLADAVRMSSERTKAELRKKQVSQLVRYTGRPMLSALLEGASAFEKATMSRTLARSGALVSSDLIAELVRDGEPENIPFVRQTILESSLPAGEKSSMIIDTLTPGEDLSWIFVDQAPVEEIIDQVSRRWTEAQLQRSLRSDRDGFERSLAWLFDNQRHRLAVQLLLDDNLDIGRRIALALPYLDRMTNAETRRIAESLTSGLRAPRTVADTALLSEILSFPGIEVPLGKSRALVSRVFQFGYPSEPISGDVLQTIILAPQKAQIPFFKAADELAKALAYWRTGELRESTYESWGLFVATADREVQSSATLEALVISFDHAVRYHYRPASALAQATFPILYRLAVNSKRASQSSRRPWSIDHVGQLRRRLVDAFYYSGWPPSVLAVIAVDCEIEEWVFELLSEKWGGADYLRRMSFALDAARSPQERQFSKLLGRHSRM